MKINLIKTPKKFSERAKDKIRELFLKDKTAEMRNGQFWIIVSDEPIKEMNLASFKKHRAITYDLKKFLELLDEK